jgi:hypothetical protein
LAFIWFRNKAPVSFPKLADLPALWDAIPRRKAPDPVYAKHCKLKLAQFADFAVRMQRGIRDFVVEELKSITDACADDDFIRPVIVTGMCTAMRRGDCCLLKWKDVDLKEGFITVKTAKTGETVNIPMFPMLREELERARAATGRKGHCFPQAAEMYSTNPDGITWRVKQILTRALGPKAVDEDRLLPAVSPDEARSLGLAYIDSLGDTPKAARMREVFNAYTDGRTLDEVMTATGASRGAVSGYLNELERETGCSIVRGKRRALNTDGLQRERGNGKRRASVRDFRFASRGSRSLWALACRSNWSSASPVIGRSRSS